jgi:hypothetical protein
MDWREQLKKPSLEERIAKVLGPVRPKPPHASEVKFRGCEEAMQELEERYPTSSAKPQSTAS